MYLGNILLLSHIYIKCTVSSVPR